MGACFLWVPLSELLSRETEELIWGGPPILTHTHIHVLSNNHGSAQKGFGRLPSSWNVPLSTSMIGKRAES